MDIHLDRATGLPVLPDDGTGQRRLLGLIPQTHPMALPRFADYHEPIPPDMWQDINLYDSYSPPVLDQGNFGSCFPAGTRIRMADGTEKPIEKIQNLDMVLTAEGNVGRVVKTQVRAATGLIRVKLWGHSHLKTTEEHPILTRRGYVSAKELKLGDWVAMPRYFGTGSNYIRTANHIRTTRYTIRQERRIRYAGVVGRASAVAVTIPLPDTIQLNAATGRIFGLFLAEGNTDSHKIVWTFNINETDTFVAELTGLLKDQWGVEASIQPKPLNGSIKVVLHGKAWSLLFESLCGTGSGHKRLHADLMSAPACFQEAMFLGWMDGDGYERRNTKQGVSVSHDLALSMFDIAQAIGLRPSIRYSEPKPSHTVQVRLPRWDVEMGGSGEDTYRCEMDESHVWRKVRGIESEDFDGFVYNIEVEGDHSYVAEGIGVHNCVGHGCCTTFTFAWLSQGEDPVRFSPCYLYGQVNDGEDQGADIGRTIAALKEKGICLESTVPEGMIFTRQFPPRADAEAANYRLIDAYYTTDPADVATAIQMGFGVADSVMVGRNFNIFDEFGLVGVDKGPGNHCVSKGGMKRLLSGTWAFINQNSWGAGWCHGGRFLTTEAHIQAQAFYAAVVYRVVSPGPRAPRFSG